MYPELGREIPLEKIEQLIAKAEIEDIMCRYARAVDRRDWPALRQCFHPDAIDEHGEFKGPPEAFIEWVTKRHEAVPFSMHFLGNCLVEFLDECSAAVETYFLAIQRRETAGPGNGAGQSATDYEVFGRYCDLFEKREGAWRVAARKVVYDSTRTLPSTNHLREIVGVMGRRDAADPVFSIAAG